MAEASKKDYCFSLMERLNGYGDRVPGLSEIYLATLIEDLDSKIRVLEGLILVLESFPNVRIAGCRSLPDSFVSASGSEFHVFEYKIQYQCSNCKKFFEEWVLVETLLVPPARGVPGGGLLCHHCFFTCILNKSHGPKQIF